MDKTQRHHSPHKRLRRGISLLEVLISMFILLFGLLGVAALFPVGQFHVSEAARYDRASALGRRAFQDIQVRGLLSPENWVRVDNGATPYHGNSGIDLPARFDPHFLSVASNNPAGTVNGSAGDIPGLNCVTAPGVRATEAAEGVFLGHDDLKIEFPEQSQLPSKQFLTSSGGTQVTDLTMGQRQFQGDYSWMFTVFPTGSAEEDLVLVSVAVFYQRDPTHEFTCTGWKYNSNFPFRLVRPRNNVANADLEHVTRGSWMLVSGMNGAGVTTPNYFKWYQIEDIALAPSDWRLTVRGPDWPTTLNTKHAVSGATTSGVTVTFFDSVVAVYEKTMRWDRPSQYSW